MAFTYQESVTLEKCTCVTCSGVFALNAEYLAHARNNKGGYFCPYCGAKWCWSESELDRVKKALSAAKCETMNEARRRDEAERAATLANIAADQAVHERLKVERKLKRVHAGVCTCCNRFVKQLAKHMQTKHPEVYEGPKQDSEKSVGIVPKKR